MSGRLVFVVRRLSHTGWLHWRRVQGGPVLQAVVMQLLPEPQEMRGSTIRQVRQPGTYICIVGKFVVMPMMVDAVCKLNG